jgi:hypothetical protein
MGILDEIAAEVDDGFLEKTVVVRKISWTLKLLCDHERNWSNGYVRSTSALALLSSMKAPILAIGIRAIGKADAAGSYHMKTVENYFVEEWTKEKGALDETAQRMLANQNQLIKQYWFAEKLFEWLSYRDPEFINELWTQWEALEKEQADKKSAKNNPQPVQTESAAGPKVKPASAINVAIIDANIPLIDANSP